ncbi:hypothetical protein J4204_03480 [Candidatus Woesearchaeota archaeon]|nr:hypothetical protein [Candidatus Woesearchaeota archaeon]
MIKMTNMTLAVPEDLHEIMRKHNEIKWSEIARQALWDHARKLELMDKLLAKSKLTEEDAERIGHKIKQGIAKRHGLVK